MRISVDDSSTIAAPGTVEFDANSKWFRLTLTVKQGTLAVISWANDERTPPLVLSVRTQRESLCGARGLTRAVRIER